MKKILTLSLLGLVMTGWATTAMAWDWRLSCYADSTLAGEPGFLMLSEEPDWINQTLFLTVENGHARLFASRDQGSQTWDLMPPGFLIGPAPDSVVGDSWSSLPDDTTGPVTETYEMNENFNTPAGNFFVATCVSRPNSDPGTITEIRRYGLGVGIVHDYFPGDGADVLTSYFIQGGTGYMTPAVGNWWEYSWEPDVSPVGDVPVSVNLLYPSVPNPFNPMTEISFEMGASDHARLRIYDAAGRLVRTLVDEERAQGMHRVTWNGRDDSGRSVATGIYLYRFEAGQSVQTRTMTLVK